MTKYKILIMLITVICGCAKQTDSIIIEKEIISAYTYERFLGHNAAIAQFGIGNEHLFVNLDDKTVVLYATNEGDITSAYADGYHNALDMIQKQNNNTCPDLH